MPRHRYKKAIILLINTVAFFYQMKATVLISKIIASLKRCLGSSSPVEVEAILMFIFPIFTSNMNYEFILA